MPTQRPLVALSFGAEPFAGTLKLQFDIVIDIDELKSMSPERIHALFSGIARINAAINSTAYSGVPGEGEGDGE